jgi:signal transduction histidine kinase/ActR/RegA family two-component response regulator
MWYTLRTSPGADVDFVSSTMELVQGTSRTLFLSAGGVFLACLIATGFWPNQIATTVWLLAPILVVTWLIAYNLLPRRFLAAHVVWHLGLAATIMLAVYVTQIPEVAFTCALLPLMAVVTIGWPAGLLAEAFVIGLATWVFPLAIAQPVPITYGGGTVLGGALAGLLGWASARSLLTVTQWSLFSFEQARQNMDEVRERRAELARVLKDLDQAYYRLERANHMLVLARSEAEEAKEARNRFALAISHELRTPLNFILGFSELMVNSPATYAELANWPAGLYEDVQEIYRSSRHLLRLVNDVLDLGQIEALRMTLLKEWAAPAEIIREVDDMVRTAFERKGLDLKIESESALPEIFVDRTRIRQVLLNLVSNSLRFTEHGGVTIRVYRDGDRLVFCVQDTGPGIAQEDIPKAFEAFRQIGSDSWRRREGAGLGIPISRRFVELHGGEMWIESEIGKGTAFYSALPLPEALHVSDLSAEREDPDVHYWQRLRAKAEQERLVLVLSPDPAAGEVIARYIDNYGVVAMQDMAQVHDKVLELMPSALILEGTTARQEEIKRILQELPYDLPVISFPFPGSPGQPKNLPQGTSGYLVKPIARETLIRTIESLGPGIRDLLVVDDDPAMVRFVTRALKGLEEESAGDGYRLTTAYTGSEALAVIERAPPEAVLLDLALPDISGWEVLDELRRRGVPTILITAHDWPQLTTAVDQEALRITMHRPLSQSELTPALQCLLQTIRPTYPEALAEPTRPTDLSA